MYLRLLLLFSLAFGAYADHCYHGFRGKAYWRSMGGMCYRFVYGRQWTWHFASRMCKRSGGTLVVPKTNAINMFIMGTLHLLHRHGKTKGGRFMIGLRDNLDMERRIDPWMWADGSEFHPKRDFDSFGPRQGSKVPILQRQGKWCVTMDRRGVWWSADCRRNGKIHGHRFICQKRMH